VGWERTFVACAMLLAEVLAGPSTAADAQLPRKARARAAADYDWTGFYLGANLGYGFARSQTAALFSDAGMGTPLFATASSSQLNGVLGGAQTGYNRQWGPWVIGWEADVQSTNQRVTTSHVCPGAVCNSTIAGFDAPVGVAHALELDWFGTLRGRLGALFTPDTLVYATGGFALGGVSHVGTISGFSVMPLLDDSGNPILDASGNPITTTAGNSANPRSQATRAGWAAGAGLEVRLVGNLTGKVEYLHMDFGSDSILSGNPMNATPIALGLHSRIADDIVRIGLNYKLDPDASQKQGDNKRGRSDKSPFISKNLLDPAWSWTGLYLGGHVGYSRGRAQATLTDLGAPPIDVGGSFGSLNGGLQIGYNYVFPSRLLLGIEADASFPNFLSADDVAWSRTTLVADTAEKTDYFATLRGRVGYAFPSWMIYATGGVAWSLGRFLQNPGVADDIDKVLHLHQGWAVGAGAEIAVAAHWAARLEYLYRKFGGADILFPSGTSAASSFDVQSVRLGLSYKFGSPLADVGTGSSAKSSQIEFENWEIHGQTTYIQQGYPAFRSPYYGQNSLTPWPQTRNTWSTSAFLSVRVWDGGVLYYNPELYQGFGLDNTTGLAGFSNGEAQKSQFAYPRYNTTRLFLQQTVGLGGEQESFEGGYGHMAGKADVSRLVFQVGKFAVHDLFDSNSYASDPRVDFLNWSIWGAGAFDYPADKVGYTYGAAAELNQKYWALRGGYFLIGNEPNSNELDMNLFRRGGYIAELEMRYSFFSRTAKLRVGIWENTYISGSFNEALDLSAITGLDPTGAIIQTWKPRTEYGYYVNFEQPLTDYVGLFGRWSWNSGKIQISAFTDINNSLMVGTAINGKAWGRPEDRVGIAGVSNGLSSDERAYLAAGGLGILIGDGQLNYRQENILETYYALNVITGVTLTFDYQYVINPAYNADRGPVSIFTGRLHAQF
jgi:high affinity Mn2+ porin